VKLYHYKVFLPATLRLPFGTFPLRYTRHAEQAARTDRYGVAPLPSRLNTRFAKVVEVETDDRGTVQKIVYRIPVSFELDLCLAVIPENGTFRVKTVWQNESRDSHATLNVNRYQRG
jgi:hypothetical protein